MRPSLTPAASKTCETPLAVPDEPSAWRQRVGANDCRPSSNSAPAATWAARKPSSLICPPGKNRIDRLTQPTPKDSVTIGLRSWPRISSVERPPMSTTKRGSSLGCRCATPA